MASGNSLVAFSPQHSFPPASNYATFSTRNTNIILEFDKDTAETIYFQGQLPLNYAGGGLTLTIFWCSTATTGNCVWGASIERHADGVGDMAADSFATEQTVTAATPGTSGLIKYSTITFTSGSAMDSLAAGEHFRLKIRRVATDGSDDLAVDAQFIGVAIKET